MFSSKQLYQSNITALETTTNRLLISNLFGHGQRSKAVMIISLLLITISWDKCKTTFEIETAQPQITYFRSNNFETVKTHLETGPDGIPQ